MKTKVTSRNQAMGKLGHRKKCYWKQLTLEKREKLFALNDANIPQTKIAKNLKVNQSTVSHELNRNSKKKTMKGKFKYSPSHAEKLAKERRKYANSRHAILMKPKNYRFLRIICINLTDQSKRLTAESLASRMIMEYGFKICGNTIRRYIDNRKPWLKRYYRFKQFGYKKAQKGEYKKFPACKSIHEREEAANMRSRKGDYEGDSVIGSGKKRIGTITDRKTRFLMANLLDSGEAIHTTYHLINELNKEGCEAKTLTVDRGSEFAYWDIVEKNTDDLKVYMTDPYNSGQKGSCERNNRELRVYYPKGTNFDNLTPEELQEKVYRINTKPRKILNYRTSYEEYYGKTIKILKE